MTRVHAAEQDERPGGVDMTESGDVDPFGARFPQRRLEPLGQVAHGQRGPVADRVECGTPLRVFDAKVRRAHRTRATPMRSRLMRRRSEEHTSELQSLMRISYAVFCLKKKTEPK